MTDWTVVSSLATAAGTLVLAGATFSAVRSSSRSARATERALLAGLLPVLAPSRIEDPKEKVRFADDHWVVIAGGHAIVEVADDAIYLTIALRNVGRGLAVLDRWGLSADGQLDNEPDAARYERLTRDIYVPGGSLGFWQGALRDEHDARFSSTKEAILDRSALTVDLLYGDHEGGQRTISRFVLTAGSDDEWLATVTRHWRLDQPDPR